MLRVLKTRRLKRIVAFASDLVVAAGMVTTVAQWHAVAVHQRALAPPSQTVRKQTTVVVKQEKRKVFPYSIVPGGAASVKEAQRAMSDPAVRAHYAAFDLKNLRQVTLTSDLVGYVSYRYGDKIFWTAKKLRLKAGETVFTDGQHIARGRCLNCYSAMPMMPTRHNEPSESTMNSPVEVPLIALAFPNLPVVPATPPAILPPPRALVAPIVPVAVGGGGGGVAGHPGFGFFPFLPIIPPIIHRHHPPTNNTPTNFPPPNNPPTNNTPPPITVTPPVSVVPEPDYLWFLIAAFASLIVFSAIRNRRKRSAKRDPAAGESL